MRDFEKELEKISEKVSNLESQLTFWKREYADLEYQTIQKQKKPFLKFEVHLCDHCNLNCMGCDHFSPLAPKHFTDLSVFKSDMERLSELFGDRVLRIHLLGGEPLLAPNVSKYLEIARTAFPNKNATIIDVLTNGLLLEKQDDAFWDACKRFDIRIRITKYPVNFDYEKAMETAQNRGVFCDYYNDVSNGEKGLFKIALSKNKKNDPCKNFFKCHIGNRCIMLKNGCLYPCTLIPNVEHFNAYFNENFYEDPHDSINIYKAQSADEILEFLHNPVPFCKYCQREDVEFMEWRASQKDIKEWT